jgi:HAD superfamily hydrolase (TIGR01509 family)
MKNSFALIFDMDGVIVDSNPYHKTALHQFCSQHGYELTEQQLREKIYGRTNKEWLTNLFGDLSEQQWRAYADEKEALYRSLFKAEIKPVAGLPAFLARMKAAAVPMAIGTSAPRGNVDFTLGSTQLEAYFPVILDDSAITHSKPHPEIYLKAAAALGYANAQCIVIEDSLSGVTAGKNSGSKVIGITTTHTAEELHEADFIISDFQALTYAQLEKLVVG